MLEREHPLLWVPLLAQPEARGVVPGFELVRGNEAEASDRLVRLRRARDVAARVSNLREKSKRDEIARVFGRGALEVRERGREVAAAERRFRQT